VTANVVGGVPTAATERDTATSGLASMPWLRSGAFWVATVISAWEEFAGSFWDLLQIEYTRSLFTHLGYPLYLLTILGIWRGLCGVALLVPGFPRLKEWAYAGAFFTYSGAVASHVVVGDGPDRLFPPVFFGLVSLMSWALRPAGWRLASRDVSPAPTAKAWAVSIVVAIVLLVLGYLSVPFAPAPYPA
jgi:DoxX-like family